MSLSLKALRSVSYRVMVVIDVFTRRFIGFAAE